MVLNQIVALVFGSTTIVYISVTYSYNCPLILESWFISIEKVICMGLLFFYGFTLYVKQQRYSYLTSFESILVLLIITPILVVNDLSMVSRFYIFVAISRYIRIAYFCIIMLKYHENELGETDIDRQTKIIVIKLVIIIVMCTGSFLEIENWFNLDYIERSPDFAENRYVLHEGYSFLYFNNALYFVIVTLITVGYGDINPTSALSQFVALFIMVITCVIIPSQTNELLRLLNMQSEY
jgi:voltage-gated potassium channel